MLGSGKGTQNAGAITGCGQRRGLRAHMLGLGGSAADVTAIEHIKCELCTGEMSMHTVFPCAGDGRGCENSKHGSDSQGWANGCLPRT